MNDGYRPAFPAPIVVSLSRQSGGPPLAEWLRGDALKTIPVSGIVWGSR